MRDRLLAARPRTRRVCPPFTSLVAGLALAITVFGLFGAQPAAAVDNTLVSATPAPNSTIETGPTTLTLVFANQLGPTNSVAMTCGAEGQPATVISLGRAVVLADQLTLSVPVASPVGKGTCSVVWRVTDTNLQPAGTSSFSFTVATDPVSTTSTTTTTTVADQSSTTTTTTVADETATSVPAADDSSGGSGSTSGPLALFRWLGTIGVAILFGSLVVITLMWPDGVNYVITVRFLRTVWGLTLVAQTLFAGTLAADIAGSSFGSRLLPTEWGTLLDTTPGTAALIRVLAVIASAFVVLAPERALDPQQQLPAFAPPVIAVATLAFGRDGFGFIELSAGLVHGFAMAAWFGGLVLLTRVVLAGQGDSGVAHAVRSFAKFSTPMLWLTVASGAVLLFRLDSGALGASHGLVAILKGLIVSAMVFVAVAARQYVAQRLQRAPGIRPQAVARLRRVLGIEATLGVVVLAATSWLLALTPPGLAGGSQVELELGTVHIFRNTSLGAEVIVTFTERVGPNDVRIEVVEPAENLSGLAVDFLPPATSTAVGLTVDVAPLTGAGVAVLDKADGFTLPTSGTWTVVVRLGDLEVAREDVFVADDTPTTTTG